MFLKEKRELTGGLMKGSFPVILENKTESHPYRSITHRGMLNTGFLVSVITAAISKTWLKDAFSPVSRYLLPTFPFFIAEMCPSTTSST